jgi:hypothetical protein
MLRYRIIAGNLEQLPELGSTDLDDLIKSLANLHKQGIRQYPEWMCLGLAQPPIEGLGLVAEHVAGLPGLASRCFSHRNRKGVVRVVSCCGHRQPDNERSFFVKDARRKYEERMDIAHFTSGLRVAVYPDNVLPVWYPAFSARWFFPRRFLGCYQRSAPKVCVVVICSPPWRLGS